MSNLLVLPLLTSRASMLIEQHYQHGDSPDIMIDILIEFMYENYPEWHNTLGMMKVEDAARLAVDAAFGKLAA